MRGALTKVSYHHQTDAARDLDANGERREKLFAGHRCLLTEGQCGRQDRRAWMNHGGVSVIVIF